MVETLTNPINETPQFEGNSENLYLLLTKLSVDVLNLRPRIKHLLERHRIHTISDLVNDFDKLSEIKGMGDKLISEIRSSLEMISVKLPSAEEDKLGKIEVTQVPDLIQEVSSTEFLSSWFTLVPPGIDLDQVSIDELNLSTRTHNSILRGGVSTLGDLVEIQKYKKDLKFGNFGPVAALELSQKLEYWVSIPEHISFEPSSPRPYKNEKGEVQASGNNSELSQRMFEFEKAKQMTPSESLDDMFASIKEDYAFILSSMYGLHSKEHMTLQEVASIKGVTRERIRQKKDAAIRQLIKKIHNQNPFPLAALLRTIIQQHHGCVSSKRLAKDLDNHLSETGYYSTGVLDLLDDIGLSNIKPSLTYLQKYDIWLSSEVDQDQAIITYQAIIDVINGKQSPIAWTDLYSRLQQNHDLLSLQEEFAFGVTLSLVDNGLVTQRKDGKYSALRLKAGRDERIQDALREIRNPTHFKNITHMHNTLFPEKLLSERSVHGVLVGNKELFVRVGRGTYGLTEWGIINDGTVANTVWRIINNRQLPMRLAEIKHEVLKVWQVESISIEAAINTDSRFIKYPDGRIGLTEKGKAVKKVNKRSDTNRLTRIRETLRSIGKPTNYREITLRHNEYFPENLLTKTAVYNKLVHKKYGFVRVGEGVFGLAEWGLEPIIDQDSTFTRLTYVLSAVTKPMHYKEIHCVHNQLYPDSQITIKTAYFTLQQRSDRFSKLGNGRYGLKEWGLTDSDASKKPTQERLREILLQASKYMHYAELHKAHNRLYPEKVISKNTVYGILRKYPNIFSRDGDGYFGLVDW